MTLTDFAMLVVTLTETVEILTEMHLLAVTLTDFAMFLVTLHPPHMSTAIDSIIDLRMPMSTHLTQKDW